MENISVETDNTLDSDWEFVDKDQVAFAQRIEAGKKEKEEEEEDEELNLGFAEQCKWWGYREEHGKDFDYEDEEFVRMIYEQCPEEKQDKSLPGEIKALAIGTAVLLLSYILDGFLERYRGGK